MRRVVALFGLTVCSAFAAWDGTSLEPSTVERGDSTFYNITSPEELAWFAAQVNGGETAINAVLSGDIVMGENETSVATSVWTPIGDATNKFAGVLDGAGFTVYGMKASGATYSGLVGYMSSTAVVRDLSVAAGSVAGTTDVGGIVGVNEGLVFNVSNKNTVSASSITAGGIVGWNKGKVIKATSSAGISGAKKNGGIVGSNSGLIQDVSVTGGTVSSNITGDLNGGIVGENAGIVTNAINKVKVSAQTNAGGVAGVNTGRISGASNLGAISAYIYVYSYSNTVNYAGGIAARNSGTIELSSNMGAANTASSEAVSYAGGFAGHNTGVITNSFTSGSIEAYSGYTSPYGGCFVGINTGNGAKISNSYCAASSVTSRTYKGVFAGVNESGALINSCYYDESLLPSATYVAVGNNKATISNSAGKSTEFMKSGEMAWLLNTTSGTATNSKIWSSNNGYPYFADESNKPVYRLTFNDDISDSYIYSTYLGAASSPEKPEPDPGYTFLGWFDSDGLLFRPRNEVAADKNYHAIFVLDGVPQYIITFINGRTTFSIATTDEGVLTDMPADPEAAEGYVFDGWYITSTDVKVDLNTVFEKETSVTAKFAAKLYTITFLDYDGSVLGTPEVAYGQIPEIENPARMRTDEYTYSFAGWDPELVKVTGETSYKAVYDSAAVTFVTVRVDGVDKTLAIGDEYILPEGPEKDGYKFVGWYDSEDKLIGKPGDKIVISGGMEIVAKYEKIVVSSSASQSSSSEKDGAESSSSSESIESSSSKKATSSSSSESIESSSSEKIESSSSSKKDEKTVSSSNSETESIDSFATKGFHVSVVGNMLQISNMKVNSRIAVFDMQGGVVYAGNAHSSNVVVNITRTGSFLVRVDKHMVRVNIR